MSSTTAGSTIVDSTTNKIYRAICCRVTTNAFGYITEKDGRLFCYKYSYLFTYLRASSGTGDLLTRQARNFIYINILWCRTKSYKKEVSPQFQKQRHETLNGLWLCY